MMLSRLLHIANTEPGWINRKQFYTMKTRLLERYGTADGHDIQHILGKACFRCDYHYSGDKDVCWKCYGTGWFKCPKWVTLKRTRLGRYTFHTPTDVSYKKPEPDTTRIEGYVTHNHYSSRKVVTAHLILCLLFERSLFWWALLRWSDHMPGWRRAKHIFGRCVFCKRRRWRWKKCRCRLCERLAEVEYQKLSDEAPF